MGIFNKDKAVTPQQRFDALIDRAVLYENAGGVDLFITALKRMKSNPETVIIKPVELCLDVLETIVFENNGNFKPSDYLNTFNDAETIYKGIFNYDEETPNFDDIRLVFIEMFTTNNIYAHRMFNIKLYNSFEDKKKYVVLCQNIIIDPDSKRVFDLIKTYGVQIREFMISDDAYLANLVRVAHRLAFNAAAAEDILKEEYDNVKHMNGVYDVDPVRIATVEQKLERAEGIVDACNEAIKEADTKTDVIKQTCASAEQKIKESEQRGIERIEARINDLKAELEHTLDEFVEGQKKTVVIDKDMLIKQVFADAQTELDKIRNMAKTITGSTSMELMSLNDEARGVFNRVNSLINDDEEVKRVMKNADETREFRDKVNMLTVLNQKAIEKIAEGETQAVEYTVKAAATADEEDLPIGPVNPLLDPSIPFEDRFKRVMKEKENRIAKGEHFHRKFDDVLIAVMENSNPYMIGPSGCGKTFMVKQIASLLNMDFIDIGYINEEFEILGFQTATGAYSKPNFYRCYKYGMIAFCDELDNGNSRATVKLNSFLSNTEDASYSFPNGEMVKRHGSFRIIAAGNTEGNGADSNYSTREKIEESVQQRFTPIYVGYDNEVEKAILKDYPDWFDFIVLFRKATDKWAEGLGGEAQGILTTRDATRIKKYLDDKSFNAEKIIEYEFVQTKDPEYLAFLSDTMRAAADQTLPSAKLVKLFEKISNEIRQKGHH
ncbi:MAG: AAA family ATPase [Lachnospiraceae bacterium]|nr:AAA family ATPase [Lachnospiraceae bacterium]